MGLNSGHFQRREYPVALRATCGVTLFRSHDPVYYKIINNEDEKSEMDRRDKMWTAKKVNKRKWKSVCDFFPLLKLEFWIHIYFTSVRYSARVTQNGLKLIV